MNLSAVAVTALLAAGGVLGVSAAAQAPPKESVSLAVTTATVRDSRHARVDTMLLWNRNERTRPVGHAVKSCLKAGRGGIRGSGLMQCTLVVSLPLGKVVATGNVHNLRRYTLVITGGTGRYQGASGPLFMRSVSGDGVRRLTFSV